MGTISASSWPTCRRNSNPSVPAPSAMCGPSNGWTKVRPSVRSISSTRAKAAPMSSCCSISAPISRQREDPRGVGVGRHDDLRVRAARARRRDRHRVVAGADRRDPARPRVVVEVEHAQHDPARLERARVLEQLELVDDRRARRRGGVEVSAFPRPGRGLAHLAQQRAPRGLDLLERRRGVGVGAHGGLRCYVGAGVETTARAPLFCGWRIRDDGVMTPTRRSFLGAAAAATSSMALPAVASPFGRARQRARAATRRG